MRRLALPLLALALLAGCATRSNPIPGPNGGQAFVIKCGSAVAYRCYEEAAAACPRGYAIVDNPGAAGGIAVPVGYGAAVVRGPTQMFIECKT